MPWVDAFDRETASRFPELEILQEEPMAAHTTFRIGGPARRFARPRRPEELTALLELAGERRWPVLLVGNGSNLLVSDRGLDRLVIHTGALERIARTGETVLRAGAGTGLACLASFALRAGLTGLEFAHGIPGSLGGAVCMNAGAYGGELSQVVTAAEAWLAGRGVVRLAGEDLAFGYRRSAFSGQRGGVLAAEFLLEPGDPKEIRAAMEELGRRRREKQPLELPSAGSTFKRPQGHFAGVLIEQCGLKGTRVGGAQVSEKHAGFIVNAGGATSADVLGLIREVQRVVKEKTGVELEPEVRIVP